MISCVDWGFVEELKSDIAKKYPKHLLYSVTGNETRQENKTKDWE